MLHYKLFRADHVPDIVGTSGSAPAAGLTSFGGRLLEFSCSMSCTVVVYTPEGFLLAYCVAKKGE